MALSDTCRTAFVDGFLVTSETKAEAKRKKATLLDNLAEPEKCTNEPTSRR